jgi:spermidine/putrescine transport system permease protein
VNAPHAILSASSHKGLVFWLTNPWRKPRSLRLLTWVYILVSLLPILVAVQFSFNDGKSVTTWQGFNLTRWYFDDPELSVWHNPVLLAAFLQSIKLAALDIAISTPLGLFLALGLARWKGRIANAANLIMMFPMVTPELVMGVALSLVFLRLYNFITLSTTAQVIGHVTFTLSYVVIIIRGRLFSIGRQYEEAAADLGATPFATLRLVVFPLLAPAIFSAMMMVFALSIDDFVISQWLSCGSDCTTVPMLIYASTRAAPSPAINALATLMMGMTLLAVLVAYLVQRGASRSGRDNQELTGLGSLGH